MIDRLRAVTSPVLKEVRGRGLWAGVEIDPHFATAREICERLLTRGVLSKETHGTVVRFAPPLVISGEDLHAALDGFEDVIGDVERGQARRPAA
jgi:ornithine--oxo-acid transaminase